MHFPTRRLTTLSALILLIAGTLQAAGRVRVAVRAPRHRARRRRIQVTHGAGDRGLLPQFRCADALHEFQGARRPDRGSHLPLRLSALAQEATQVTLVQGVVPHRLLPPSRLLPRVISAV